MKFLLLIMLLCISCSTTYKQKIPEGVKEYDIIIETTPTEAIIVVENDTLGLSPLVLTTWAFQKRRFTITAIPVYKNQYHQKLVMIVPPIPNKINIHMDLQGSESVDYKEDSNQAITIIKDTVTVVKTEILPIITFQTDSFNVTTNQIEKIKKVYDYFSSQKGNRIILKGFADERGSDEYNQSLSLKRSQSVAKQLIKFGVDSSRINVEAFGEISAVLEKQVKVDYSGSRFVMFIIEK